LGAADLLVQASLEAVLSKTGSRHDTIARFERVKAAALMECAENGYSALTMVGIARRAKVSTASIYAAFEDRDAVLVAAMEMLFTIMAGDVIEVPKNEDAQDRVEQLLIAHGFVYLQPLTLWTFRLHMILAWSGHGHLQEMGLRIFQGIDAFWRCLLGELVAEGHLIDMNYEEVVPLLLGPIERCTIISRLSCGDEENEGLRHEDVARYGAQMLFSLWGSDAWWAAKGGQSCMSIRANRSDSENQNLTEHRFSPAHQSELAYFDPPSCQERLELELSSNRQSLTNRARRDRLLLAAAVVCQQNSYKAASMQDVADRSRISTASIYKVFDDKADLFVCALEAELNTRGAIPRLLLQGSWEIDVARTLFVIAKRAIDPQWAWMHNIVMGSEISGTPPVVIIARQSRQMEESFLKDVVFSHPKIANLECFDEALIVNWLLGALERRGVLSLLLFGRGEVEIDDLYHYSVLAAGNFGRYLQA
jgi:AcrR family transcriptional regulator